MEAIYRKKRKKEKSSKYYEKRKREGTSKYLMETIKSEIRYIYVFNNGEKNLRKDIYNILRKYNANICASNFVKDIQIIKNMPKDTNIGIWNRRDKMNEYIDSIISTLNRDWEINKLLKEDND
jgi:hypothetical protein